MVKVVSLPGFHVERRLDHHAVVGDIVDLRAAGMGERGEAIEQRAVLVGLAAEIDRALQLAEVRALQLDGVDRRIARPEASPG